MDFNLPSLGPTLSDIDLSAMLASPRDAHLGQSNKSTPSPTGRSRDIHPPYSQPMTLGVRGNLNGVTSPLERMRFPSPSRMAMGHGYFAGHTTGTDSLMSIGPHSSVGSTSVQKEENLDDDGMFSYHEATFNVRNYVRPPHIYMTVSHSSQHYCNGS